MSEGERGKNNDKRKFHPFFSRCDLIGSCDWMTKDALTRLRVSIIWCFVQIPHLTTGVLITLRHRLVDVVSMNDCLSAVFVGKTHIERVVRLPQMIGTVEEAEEVDPQP